MDCNKTIDFFAEAKRLCDSRTACSANEKNKERCPLFVFCKCTITTRSVEEITTRSVEEITTAIKNLQKWSDKRSKKTYAQDFFEKFPDAPRCKSANGRYPSACRKAIYDGKCPGVGCEECWNEPMEE